MNMRFNIIIAGFLTLALSLVNVAQANISQVELTINYFTSANTTNITTDHTLLRTYFDSSTAAKWNPEPATSIVLADEMDALLKNDDTGRFSGSVVYGVADYCGAGPVCDPAYQFTVTVSSTGCSSDKTNMGLGTDREYTIQHDFDPIGTCIIDVTYIEPIPDPTPQGVNVQIANLSNNNGEVGGTLTAGSLAVYEGTTCSANNPADCFVAVQNSIAAGATSALFSFSAANQNNLNATLSYPISDPQLPGSTTYSLVVQIDNAAQVPDRCQASISPPMTGAVKYTPEVVQVGAEETCQVNLFRDMQPLPDSPAVTVAIVNQSGQTPGAQHSYALVNGYTQLDRGQFTITNPANIPVSDSNLNVTNLTALDGATDHYQGKVFFKFDDKSPAGLEIDLNSANAAICDANITDENQGERIYHVDSVQISGPAANSVCTITIVSTAPPAPPADSPQIAVTIHNQTTKALDGRQFTHALIDGKTTPAQGSTFTPPNPSNVSVGQSITVTTLQASGGSSSHYQGYLAYAFDDAPNDQGVPTGLLVDLDNSTGDIAAFCNANITDPNANSEKTYTIHSVVIAENPAVENGTTCAITISSTDVPPPQPPTTPEITLVVLNQLDSSPGTGSVSYALTNGQTAATSGSFNPASPNIRDIAAGQNTNMSVTVLKADTLTDAYAGTVTFTFADIANGANTDLVVTFNNSTGNLPELCTPAITGPNVGNRIYSSSATHSGDITNAICTVVINSKANSEFLQFNSGNPLSTVGNLGWEHYNIAGTDYLAAANSTQTTKTSSSYNVFKLNVDGNNNNPLSFSGLQFLGGSTCYIGSSLYLVNHPFRWMHFNIAGVDRIAMANNYSYTGSDDCDFNTYTTRSSVYTWSASTGQFSGTGITYYTADSPLMSEFYTTAAGSNNLAVAESNKAGTSIASVYRWNGTQFDPIQQSNQSNQGDLSFLYGTPVSHMESFTENSGNAYVIMSRGAVPHEVLVYQADNSTGALGLYQGSVVTSDLIAYAGYVRQSKVFKVGGSIYLVLGYEPKQTVTRPTIYKWQPSAASGGKNVFVPIQGSLPTDFPNPQAWEFFSADGLNFLVAAFDNGNVVAYPWSDTTQQVVTSNPYTVWTSQDNIADLTAFNVNNTVMLALARYADGTGNTSVSSPIIIWESRAIK